MWTKLRHRRSLNQLCILLRPIELTRVFAVYPLSWKSSSPLHNNCSSSFFSRSPEQQMTEGPGTDSAWLDSNAGWLISSPPLRSPPSLYHLPLLLLFSKRWSKTLFSFLDHSMRFSFFLSSSISVFMPHSKWKSSLATFLCCSIGLFRMYVATRVQNLKYRFCRLQTDSQRRITKLFSLICLVRVA